MIVTALALLGVAEGAEPLRRHALLVGANDGGPGRATLRYAHRDAESMAEVLTTLGGVAYADRTVLYDPSPAELDAAIDALAADIGRESGRTEVIFYYSGHSDESGLLLGGEPLPYRDLRDSLETIPADVRLAILDSCASGALIRAKGGSPVPGFMVDEANTVGGFAYITSSSEDEVAQEGDRVGGSFFTHFLASGLRGAADYSGDGRVTLDEVYSFAHEETLARTERTQYGPQHAARDTQLSGTGDLVLTDLGLTSATLVLEEDLAGQALVRDARGRLVAELDKPIGREIQLGLPEGTYDLTLVQQDARYALASVDVENGTSSLLSASDLVWYDAESTVARGDVPVDAPLATLAGARNPARTRPFHPSIVTFDSKAEVTDNLAISLIGGTADAVDGAAIALGFYQIGGSTSGALGALGFTMTREIDGAQLALAGNGAEEGQGAQLAIGANVVTRGFDGLQGAVGVNIATGQGLRGAQLSSGINIATEINGLQASLVNIADDVEGLQLGLVNFGTRVNGAQIGLINVADDVRGSPIGLLSIERKGRHDVLVSASTDDLANLELKLGGDHFYTAFAGGGTPGQHVYAQLGFGGHIPIGSKVWTDVDAGWASYADLDAAEGPFEQSPEGIVRVRGTVGWQVLKELAPFAGAGVQYRVPLEDTPPVLKADGMLVPDEPDGTTGADDTVASVFPSVFVGVQF
jgi:hypothetical protein